MHRRITICFLLFISPGFSGVSAQGLKALFDFTKDETAGNADWIIDSHQPIPSPAQSGIVQSTSETYWLGAISAWGVDLVKLGFTVHTLTRTYGISYNNASNAYDLSRYNVFIVCEPQDQFTAAEKQAIASYVQNGGGLVMVGDHYGSDRNSNGWDSPRVWNDLRSDSLFGIHFQVANESNNNFSQVATNVASVANDSIIHGPAGVATTFSFHNGTSITLLPSSNTSVRGHIWMNGAPQGTTQAMVATARYGSGRVAAAGDSSPADDGTGESGHTVYNGWTESGATDNIVFLNMTLWAAASSVRASVVALLEGPYDSTTTLMNKTLKTSGTLASHFTGVPIPVQAVDSISIELRNTALSPTIKKFRPAWLLANGSIRSFTDTTKSYVEFDTTAGSYYLIVHHRNHLAVMTSGSVALNSANALSYDFTTAQTQAYGTNPMILVNPGVYAMYAGDGNASGIISASDANGVFGALNTTGYDPNDINLSGIVTSADANMVFGNLSRSSQVPSASASGGKERLPEKTEEK